MTVNEIVQRLLYELPAGIIDDLIAVINRRVAQFQRERVWSHYESEHQFDLEATYDTGTATATNGSTTVSGSGTTWTSDHVGWKITFSGSAHYYTVSSVDSTTQITLTEDFFEDTVSAVTYTLYQDTYDLPSDFARLRALENLDSGCAYMAHEFELWQGAIVFANVPPDVYPLKLYYWTNPTAVSVVTSSVDVPSFAEEAIYYGVLIEYLGRQMPASEWARRLSDAKSQYVQALTSAKARDTQQDGRTGRLQRVVL